MRNHYVDAHLHLQDSSFAAITEELIERAGAVGVRQMFCNAVAESDWNAVAELAAGTSGIIPFFGIHPWFCQEAAPGWQERLATVAASFQNRPVGIGETGLDKLRAVNFETQRRTFIQHLDLAAELSLPVSVHCVRAWGPLVDTLRTMEAAGRLPKLLIHSFSGSTETMKRLVDFGCLISYSAMIARDDKQKLRRTVARTPLSALMLETDAPYQKNQNLKDVDSVTADLNEPVAVAALYRYTAALMQVEVHDLSSQILKNAAIFTNQTADR